jgi:hypothetical protein
MVEIEAAPGAGRGLAARAEDALRKECGGPGRGHRSEEVTSAKRGVHGGALA